MLKRIFGRERPQSPQKPSRDAVLRAFVDPEEIRQTQADKLHLTRVQQAIQQLGMPGVNESLIARALTQDVMNGITVTDNLSNGTLGLITYVSPEIVLAANDLEARPISMRDASSMIPFATRVETGFNETGS